MRNCSRKMKTSVMRGGHRMGNCSDAYVIDARLTCLQALMKNTGWSLEQALNALKIPAKEHIKYAMLLGENVSEN